MMKAARVAPVWALVWALTPLLAAPTEAPELRFRDGTFRPLDRTQSAPAWYRAEPVALSAGGARYLVAVLEAPASPADRAALLEAGAELLDYLPKNGFRVRLAPGNEAAVRGLPFVAWLGPAPAHHKVDASLTEAVAGGEAVPVRVILAAGEPAGRALAGLAGEVVSAAPSGPGASWRIEATVPGHALPARLSALAALPEVEAIEPVRPLRLLNQDAVWVHQSFTGPSDVPVFAQGIYGCGQVIGVADTGQDHDSCFFVDPVGGAPPVESCVAPPCPPGTSDPSLRKDILYFNWSGGSPGDDDTCPSTFLAGSGHGTHTSGSAAGDSAPYADCAGHTGDGRNGGDGQAPGAKLIIQELGDGLEYLTQLGGSVWNVLDAAYLSGVRIHSSSWGGSCRDLLGQCVPGCTLPYDSFARDADMAAWAHADLLPVYSAGNGGGVCAPPAAVTTPALAKSPIAAAAVGHGANAGLPEPTSSPGPVFDGRLKPTLAAQGAAVVSAASNAMIGGGSNCGTCSLDGTSMSAPTVAGLAALVREYYEAGFHASGVRDPGQGLVPSGALLKATLIDGAVALGAPAPGADFQSGYGRVQLDRTLAFSGDPFDLRVVDHREGLTSGSVVSRAYDVAAGESLRATLVWMDYPSALNAATARVNELQLEVTDPSGDVWFQTIDGGSGLPLQTNVVSALHDDVNVTERLVFDAPQAGRWVFRVIGVDVPMSPQPFALVVRGALADCAAPPAPLQPDLTLPADQQVQVSWDPVPGAAGYNVYRALAACDAGPWVPLATGLTSTSFLDSGLSGGVEYSYHVTAVSDGASACESPRSPCAGIVPGGECLLVPAFDGVETVVADGVADCSVTLHWSPGAAACPGGDPRYNVYRDTTPGFVPGPANRIARCVGGTSFTDAANLAHGTPYHYVVRAEDDTAGHGGPCRGGNEETNAVTRSVAPVGPSSLGTWSDDAGDGAAAEFDLGLSWSVEAAGGDTGPAVYEASSAALLCADLTSPVLTLGSPGDAPQLSFSTVHELEYDPGGIFGAEGSAGQVEIATGPDFDGWTRVELTPDYPGLVEFPFNECSTTELADTYFTGFDTVYDTYTGSLVNWAGGDVRIRFHLSGDFIYPGGFWRIDDVVVTQTQVPGACATAAAGPPPIPDGASVPGAPMRAERSGNDVAVSWDTTSCPAASVNVYRGAIGDYTTFTGGTCALPSSGSATLAIPDGSWFLVAAVEGDTDGSWSRTAGGEELSYAGAAAACPAVTAHSTSHACP